MRVLRLRILAVKNSMKRRLARSPWARTIAGSASIPARISAGGGLISSVKRIGGFGTSAALPGPLLFLAHKAKPARLYVTEAVLAEYREVLSRPELKIRRGLREQLLQLVKNRAHLVSPAHALQVAKDPATTSFWSVPMLPVPTTW